MDAALPLLFNNGDNDGDIVIVSTIDKVEIRCHKWIVRRQARYFADIVKTEKEAKRRKTDEKTHQKIIRLTWYVRTSIIRQAIHFLYNSQYKLDVNLEARDLFSLFDLVEQLQFTQDTKNIMENIFSLFCSKLTKDNWLALLIEAFPNNTKTKQVIDKQSAPHHQPTTKIRFNFSDIILAYYMNYITVADDFIVNDPLNGLELHSLLGQYVMAIYRLWINKCRNWTFRAMPKQTAGEIKLIFVPSDSNQPRLLSPYQPDNLPQIQMPLKPTDSEKN